MRFAIYFTPDPNHRLTRAAAGWLGRDAFGGDVPPVAEGGMPRAEITPLIASAARYGFHATLKAPFHLRDEQTEAALASAIARFAKQAPPVDLGQLVLTQMDGFFALVTSGENAALQALAGDVVKAFDHFRAPPTAVETARRNPDSLPQHERDYLARWGYPYVFDAFRFHMTLTDRIAAADAGRVRAALDEALSAILAEPVMLDRLALCVEPEAGAPFMVRSMHMLAGSG